MSELIAPGVWRLALRTPTLPPATTTNTLIIAGARVAVIEPATPHPEESARIDAELARLHEEGRELAYLLVTHHHRDHIGDVERLQARWGGEICAHAETARRVPFAVGRSLEGGDRLDLGEGYTLEAHYTPGHAPGHLVYEWLEGGVAHAGDLVAGEGTILVDPRDDGDMQDYFASLERMRRRFAPGGEAVAGARWVPAHGPVLEAPAELCSAYLAHRQGREDKILAALASHERLAWADLLASAYDDKPREILPLAAGALEAHLVKLGREGRVERRVSETGGVELSRVDVEPPG